MVCAGKYEMQDVYARQRQALDENDSKIGTDNSEDGNVTDYSHSYDSEQNCLDRFAIFKTHQPLDIDGPVEQET
jgi:hypothetical protein